MWKVVQANRQFSRTALVLIAAFFIGMTNAVNATVKIISPVKNQIIRYRNQSVLFNCTVTQQSNGSTFQWFKDAIPINPPGKVDTPRSSSFVLADGLRVEDEGRYKCSYGESSYSVTVHLAAKPKTVSEGKTSPLSVKVNDPATLKCYVTGWPTPNITWTLNGQNVLDINHNSQYQVTKEGMTSRLDIISIQIKDGGDYYCMAKNALGNSSLTYEVIVEEGPVINRPTMTAESSTYTAVVGTNAILVCNGDEVEDDASTFVYWIFNGTVLNNSSDYIITKDFYSREAGSTPKVRTQLTVLSVTFSDSGNYSCFVDNIDVKNEGDTITLEVKAKAKDKKNKPDKLKTWIIVVVSVVAVILCLVLAVLIIVVCLRRRKKKKLLALAEKYDEEDNQNFENDLFISYSGKDYDWVEESLLSLFKENSITYIIHSRDFIPGKAWHENMADSVYNSRKVILVMSANYLSSGYCKEEMGMAIHRNAVKNDSSLILVRIDNTKSCDIPKGLRHKTFIDVTSKEETNTWKQRILDYVRSDNKSNRSDSVTSEESIDVTEGRSLLSRIKLKMNKKRDNAERELENQA